MRSNLTIFVPPDPIGQHKKPAMRAHPLWSGWSGMPKKIFVALPDFADIRKFCELNVH